MVLELKDDRAPGAIILDRFLALVAAAEVRDAGGTFGSTKLQKLFFLAKISLSGRGYQVPSVNFVRYHYGPFSAGLKLDEGQLGAAGLLSNSGLTLRGRRVLATFLAPVAEAARAAVETVSQLAKERAKWTAERAKREAYAVEYVDAAGVTRSLREAPEGVEFLIAPQGTPRPVTLAPSLLVDLGVALGGPERLAAASRAPMANASIVRGLLA